MWILFYISLTLSGDNIQRVDKFETMSECFDAWSETNELLNKPKDNEQLICIFSSLEIDTPVSAEGELR